MAKKPLSGLSANMIGGFKLAKTVFEEAPMTVVSSGAVSLDTAMATGGFPFGYYTEIYGKTHSGKSALALSAVAQAQKLDIPTFYFDTEQRFQEQRATQIGVDLNKLQLAQTSYVEDYITGLNNIFDAKLSERTLIVVDSLGALTTRKAVERKAAERPDARELAMLISESFRSTSMMVRQNKACILVVNHMKTITHPGGWTEEVTAGGEKKYYLFSQRLRVSKVRGTPEEAEKYRCYKVKVIKNTFAPEGTEASYRMFINGGIDQYDDLFQTALGKDVIKQSGAFYSYRTFKAQGREAFMAKLKASKKMMESITHDIQGTTDSGLAPEQA
jgi:recombination protein RecA